MFNIQEELKKLPNRPGVYLMHDEEDRVIYVGKAIILKNRVRQYFQPGYKRSPKIESMVSQVAWFEYIVTDSETEALVLECNLIKEHAPKYNTRLTDDKAYPFIRISVFEEYPRIFFAHHMGKDASRYFGPYTNAGAVREIIKLVQRLYHIRSCSRKLPRDIGKSRPCLNSQIGLCDAPCNNQISAEDYGRLVKSACEFLSGSHEKIKKELEGKMYAASERMAFEEAGGFKELLDSINRMDECQKISRTDGENRDIIAVARDEAEAVAQILFVREGKLIGRDHFHLCIAEGDEPAQIIAEVVKQYYAGTPYIPREILLEIEPEGKELLSMWLSGKCDHKVEFFVPQRGDKYHLLELATDNAKLLLAQNKEQVKRKEARTLGAMRELAKLIGVPGLSRMEAFDISNISGFLSVGSMVVFEDGTPRPNEYRKFKIKSVNGPDDYASLYEVIYRRISHGLAEKRSSFAHLPDVIMMDGGKGQVGVAQQALSELGVSIPVCGMVKDDNHHTRALFYNGKELNIDKHSELFHLITHLQDEAHRFAISYHRALRGKDQVHSVLDDIPGIGEVRRRSLMKAFNGIDEIKKASTAELVALPSMNEAAAKMVYAFFHDGEIEN